MARKRKPKSDPGAAAAPATPPDRHSGVALPDPNVIDAEFTVRPPMPETPQLPGPPPIPSPLLLSGPTASPPLIDPQALMHQAYARAPREQPDVQDTEFTVRQPTPQLSAPALPARPALPAPPPRAPITDPAFLLPPPVASRMPVAQLQAPPASAPPPPLGAPPGAPGAVPAGQPDYSSVSHVRGVPELVQSLAKGAPEYQGKDQLLHQRLQEMVRLQQLLVDAQQRAKSADPQERAAGRDEAFRLDAAFGGTVRELSAQQKVLTGEYAARSGPLTGVPVDPRTAAAIAQATGQGAGQPGVGTAPAPTTPAAGQPGPVPYIPPATTVQPPALPATVGGPANPTIPVAGVPMTAPPIPGPVAPAPLPAPAPPPTMWDQFTTGLGGAGRYALEFSRTLDRTTRDVSRKVSDFGDLFGGSSPIARQIKGMFAGTTGGAVQGFAMAGPMGAVAGGAAGMVTDTLNLGAAASPQAGETASGTMSLLQTRIGATTGSDVILNRLSSSVQAISEKTKDSGLRDVVPEVAKYIPSLYSAIYWGGRLAGAEDKPALEAPPIVPGVGSAIGGPQSFEQYAQSFGMSSLEKSPVEMQKILEQLTLMTGALTKVQDNTDGLRNLTPAWRD